THAEGAAKKIRKSAVKAKSAGPKKTTRKRGKSEVDETPEPPALPVTPALYAKKNQMTIPQGKGYGPRMEKKLSRRIVKPSYGV
ncbi:hypothetical protein BC829DRAFT_404147, partial [Chytridium lagenaria]